MTAVKHQFAFIGPRRSSNAVVRQTPGSAMIGSKCAPKTSARNPLPFVVAARPVDDVGQARARQPGWTREASSNGEPAVGAATSAAVATARYRRFAGVPPSDTARTAWNAGLQTGTRAAGPQRAYRCSAVRRTRLGAPASAGIARERETRASAAWGVAGDRGAIRLRRVRRPVRVERHELAGVRHRPEVPPRQVRHGHAEPRGELCRLQRSPLLGQRQDEVLDRFPARALAEVLDRGPPVRNGPERR